MKSKILQKANIRNVIAVTTIFLGVVGTLLLAIWLLIVDGEAKTFIGQSLLPLWGTWVGTVLAFYFGKENFEAASKSYQDVIKSMTLEQKIAGIKVEDEMIRLEDIKYIEFSDETLKHKIIDILQDRDFTNYQRIVFITNEKLLKYVIHKSTLALFLTESLNNSPENLVLSDLLNYKSPESKIPKIIEKSFAFIPLSSNMLAAKILMDAIPECQDIFITENGKSSEPVLGFITNNQIVEKCKI
ncbi:MAG: hypothetical protein C0596_09485 [Marinilabiliales bacterium]|mgnify:CR=1 FL=1|nr:MAG: hypothetical protein C0596_09485 [Marinilabiliales bacterium]